MGSDRLVPFDRIPSQSLEGEQAVLGSMLLDRKAIEVCSEILSPEDFYRDAHRVIFEAIIALVGRGEQVDLLTVREELRRQDVYENVGGGPYLAQLQNAVPAATNAEWYARIVEEKTVRRRILDAANQLQVIAYAEQEIEVVIARAEVAVLSVAEKRKINSTAGEVRGDRLPEARDLDPLWFGLYPGMATLLAGETGAGKSSLLYNVAIHASRNETFLAQKFGLRRPLLVLYVDPENAGDYRGAQLDGGTCRRKVDRILPAGESLPPTLVFADGRGMDLTQAADVKLLDRRVKRGIEGHPFDLVILDPLRALAKVNDENDNAEMGAVGYSLMTLAHETGVAVLFSHHTGKPRLGSADGVLSHRGAAALADHADVVMSWRARGHDGADEDDSYGGERRERRDVCRLKIWKDRPGMFSTAALYPRMAGNDRFELATFAEWKEAGQQRQEEDPRAVIREVLADGLAHTRASIQKACKDEGMGRDNTDRALGDMTRRKEITRITGPRGMLIYQLAGARPDAGPAGNGSQNGSESASASQFPSFLSDSGTDSRARARQETRKLGNWETGTVEEGRDAPDSALVSEFFAGMDAQNGAETEHAGAETEHAGREARDE